MTKCLTCGSFIHETRRCYVWQHYVYCNTEKIYKTMCDCRKCINGNRCQYCNHGVKYCGHDGRRCNECNEFLVNGACRWDHTKQLCEFCNFPFEMYDNSECMNHHNPVYNNDCDCGMPVCVYRHEHDGNECSICGALLDEGSCINRCVGGGKFCIYCNYEGVIYDRCQKCKRKQKKSNTKQAQNHPQTKKIGRKIILSMD